MAKTHRRKPRAIDHPGYHSPQREFPFACRAQRLFDPQASGDVMNTVTAPKGTPCFNMSVSWMVPRCSNSPLCRRASRSASISASEQ